VLFPRHPLDPPGRDIIAAGILRAVGFCYPRDLPVAFLAGFQDECLGFGSRPHSPLRLSAVFHGNIQSKTLAYPTLGQRQHGLILGLQVLMKEIS